jgi:nitroreductase
MDVIKAIKARYTVRAFKPVPVSKELLEELIAVALQAPSWANTQTWEFAIVGGEVMDELRRTLIAKSLANEERNPDIPHPKWPPPYLERSKENGRSIYQLLGITREDTEKRAQWFAQMHSFFGAPNCIIIYTDKGISEWRLFNIGLITQNIALAALRYGLGTSILAASVGFPDDVRQILKIPESKQLVISIAIGYPDLEDKINGFRSNRVPLDTISTWHGF